jgi:hypothetical protein
MNNFKSLVIILCLGLLSVQYLSNSDKLNVVIAKYEAQRDYEFELNKSVENTIKYYKAEAEFAERLKKELAQISEEGLSESKKFQKNY